MINKYSKYINYFVSPIIQVDIIRNYCIEKGKDEIETELFLRKITNKTSLDFLQALARYCLSKMLEKDNIVQLLGKDNRIIKIYVNDSN